MTDSIGVGNSFPAALFFHVEIGSEEKVVANLKRLGYVNLFKAFGQYDIIALFDSRGFEDEKVYASCDDVHAVKPLISFALESESYQSPNIDRWCSEAPIIGFVFLELDKWFYSQESGAHSSLEAYSVLISKLTSTCEELGIDIALYGGFGRSELYLVVRSSNIEDIWKVSNECRALNSGDCFPDTEKEHERLPIFVSTRTIPGVSFSNINYKDEASVTGISGKTQSAISIKCPSGFEYDVYRYFENRQGYSCFGTLGNDDIFVHTDAIDFPLLIEDILNFRKHWSEKHYAPISTKTILQSKQEPQEHINQKAYGVEKSYESLVIPEQLKISNKRLANRIHNFNHNLQSNWNNRNLQSFVRGVAKYLEYIKQLLEEYSEACINGVQHDGCPQESMLLQAVERAETGLTQRVGSSFDSLYYKNDLPLPFGDGIFASLIGIEFLIDSIFESWDQQVNSSSDAESKTGAFGFPTFNDSSGFKVHFGETINLPLVALYDPSDSRGNWLTLTHEISHAIYIRQNIGEIEASTLNEIYINHFSRKASMNEDEEFLDQIFELFAHWYDYYHFYDCDYEKYFAHVWASWSKLPILHYNIKDYVFRTYFIYVAHKKDMFSEYGENKVKDSQIATLIYKEHYEKLKLLKSPLTPEAIASIKDKIVTSEITTHLLKYYDVIQIFERYKSDDFRRSINKDYENFDRHYKSIMNGELIQERIENPYKLVKKIIYHTHDSANIKSATALIMSLKNQQSFYSSKSAIDSM